MPGERGQRARVVNCRVGNVKRRRQVHDNAELSSFNNNTVSAKDSR